MSSPPLTGFEMWFQWVLANLNILARGCSTSDMLFNFKKGTPDSAN